LLPPDEYQAEQEIEPSLVKEGPINLFSAVQPKQLSLGEKAAVEKRAHKLLREGEQKKIREKLDKLFAGSGDDKLFNEKEADEIRHLLSNCKILDPACGSGAFPMGMLYRLEELHEAIGVTESQEDLRLKILSNNIFGVDIMPMAVDISRLRAWLAIVLVCDYKKADLKHNFGVSPLPNLDFKFVCANTLIDVPEDEYVNRMAHAELQEFEILTNRYFAAKFQEKEEIKVQIQNCLNAIAGYHQKAIQQVERSLEDGSGKRSKTKHTKGKQQSLESLMKHYETQKKQWESYTHIFENKPV
jgi:predicted RNA methylase